MSTTRVIRVHEVGGPEALRWEEAPVEAPGKGQVRVRHRYVGLNFIDVYHRTGLYKQPLPFTPGMEGAGEVVALGPEGTGDLRLGDRVAYAGGSPGAYSEERVLPADRLVVLPPTVEERTAAAMMLKGMTAQYLLHQTIAVRPGDTILIHAAAGGVGLIVCQWARHLGATVIGTAGGEEKGALARAHGCHHVIDYRRESFPDRVREITGGKGVRVVYDSVGKDTFDGSLECLSVRGMLVLFGQSSGSVAPVDPSRLAAKCLYLTRPSLFPYTAKREELLTTANALFDVVSKGVVKIRIARSFPLARATEAHRALESRKTTGSTVLEV
jgi:NADPH2:quinone reductase